MINSFAYYIIRMIYRLMVAIVPNTYLCHYTESNIHNKKRKAILAKIWYSKTLYQRLSLEHESHKKEVHMFFQPKVMENFRPFEDISNVLSVQAYECIPGHIGVYSKSDYRNHSEASYLILRLQRKRTPVVFGGGRSWDQFEISRFN